MNSREYDEREGTNDTGVLPVSISLYSGLRFEAIVPQIGHAVVEVLEREAQVDPPS